VCAPLLTSCAPSIQAGNFGVALPPGPAVRATLTPIPKGPLDANASMRFVAKLRRSEVRNYRAVGQWERYYGIVRKGYAKRKGKA